MRQVLPQFRACTITSAKCIGQTSNTICLVCAVTFNDGQICCFSTFVCTHVWGRCLRSVSIVRVRLESIRFVCLCIGEKSAITYFEGRWFGVWEILICWRNCGCLIFFGLNLKVKWHMVWLMDDCWEYSIRDVLSMYIFFINFFIGCK